MCGKDGRVVNPAVFQQKAREEGGDNQEESEKREEKEGKEERIQAKKVRMETTRQAIRELERHQGAAPRKRAR